MKTILYFIADPTDEQIAFAKAHQMVIRNPQAYSLSDYIEQCDAVYGDAPQAYLDKFPVFELPEMSDSETDLTKLKNDELKSLLMEKGISFNPNAKKDELIALLQQSELEPKE
ncbi:HeH/LEM domain-containing protein [Ursidibacter arcticus]